MGTYAGDPTLFPTSAVLPDDGAAGDALDLNPGVEASLDRTAFLNRRTVATTAIGPVDLNAITGMVDGETRNIAGSGFYVYRSSSTAYADGLLVVLGHGGTGRWLMNEYNRPVSKLILTETAFGSGSSTAIASDTKDTPDPAARNGGLVGVQYLITANTFDFRTGDIAVISWSFPFHVVETGNASDLVVAAGFKLSAGPTWGFNDNLTDASGAESGSYSHGIPYSGFGLQPRYTYRGTISKSTSFAIPNNSLQGSHIILTACYDALNGGDVIRQGMSLSVAHYRQTL